MCVRTGQGRRWHGLNDFNRWEGGGCLAGVICRQLQNRGKFPRDIRAVERGWICCSVVARVLRTGDWRPTIRLIGVGSADVLGGVSLAQWMVVIVVAVKRLLLPARRVAVPRLGALG